MLIWNNIGKTKRSSPGLETLKIVKVGMSTAHVSRILDFWDFVGMKTCQSMPAASRWCRCKGNCAGAAERRRASGKGGRHQANRQENDWKIILVRGLFASYHSKGMFTAPLILYRCFSRPPPILSIAWCGRKGSKIFEVSCISKNSGKQSRTCNAALSACAAAGKCEHVTWHRCDLNRCMYIHRCNMM